jgi:hypothetical protein
LRAAIRTLLSNIVAKNLQKLRSTIRQFSFNPDYSTAHIGDDLPVAIDSNVSLQFAQSRISNERSHH